MLLREVLYTIAKSKLDTPRIKEVRQAYRLDSLFPEAPAAGAEFSAVEEVPSGTGWLLGVAAQEVADG